MVGERCTQSVRCSDRQKQTYSDRRKPRSDTEGELSKEICILSLEECGRLEHWGIWPTCKAHLHMKKSKAIAAVTAETHRFVGGPDTKVEYVSAIVPVNTSRVWTPVQCHSVDGKLLLGMRTWGLAPLR